MRLHVSNISFHYENSEFQHKQMWSMAQMDSQGLAEEELDTHFPKSSPSPQIFPIFDMESGHVGSCLDALLCKILDNPLCKFYNSIKYQQGKYWNIPLSSPNHVVAQ